METRGCLNIKMSSYQYRDPHVKDKTVSWPSIFKLLFVPFEFYEDPYCIPYFEYDPDVNLFNEISQNTNFNATYYLEDGFKKCVTEMQTDNANFFSLFHMNTRSTRTNLSKMLAYLEVLTHKFDIIGLSETWLKESEIDLYNIHGYNHVAIPRIYADRLYLRNTFSNGVWVLRMPIYWDCCWC